MPFRHSQPTLPVNSHSRMETTKNSPMLKKQAPSTRFSMDKFTVPPMEISAPASTPESAVPSAALTVRRSAIVLKLLLSKSMDSL